MPGKKCYLLTFLLLPFFKWQMSLNCRAILLSLYSFLIFFHFRPNVFFVVARLTSDNCNPPLLVCVVFLFVWKHSDGQTIEKYVGCFMPALNIWPCGTTSVTTVSSYCKTHRHATYGQTPNKNIMFKKKIDIGRKGFWPMNFNDFAKHIDVVL